MIVAAAIQAQGLTCSMPAPHRHHHVLGRMTAMGLRRTELWEEGFVDDTGRFLDRLAAMRHAMSSGQPMKIRGPGQYQGDELFSEDLW